MPSRWPRTERGASLRPRRDGRPARARHFFRTTLLDQLEKVDLARLAGQLLDVLTADRRHQDLLDALLRKLAAVLNDASLKARIAEVIATEVHVFALRRT